MQGITKYSQLFSSSTKHSARNIFVRRWYSVKEKNCEEIQIPMPWGHISAKWWGPKNKRPFLCTHGWQDNSGTFDRLAPMLIDYAPLLAIDYPGHGLSSKYGPGMFYHPIDVPIILRRIQKFFQWPTLSIMAHSLSANLCFLYASLFPDDTDIFIALDGMMPFSKIPGEFIERTTERIDLFLKYDEKNNSKLEPPSYKYEELAPILRKSSRDSFDIDKCHYVIDRMIKKSNSDPDKFYFTRDIRLKSAAITSYQHEDLKVYATRVKCPMMFIRTTKSKYIGNEKYMREIGNIIKSHNKNFKFVEFPGKHHAHLNEPENMIGIIREFIITYDKADRSNIGRQLDILTTK